MIQIIIPRGGEQENVITERTIHRRINEKVQQHTELESQKEGIEKSWLKISRTRERHEYEDTGIQTDQMRLNKNKSATKHKLKSKDLTSDQGRKGATI